MNPLDRTLRPPSGPIPPYAFPDVTEDRLENGMGLRLARKAEFPLVTAMVVLDAGEASAPTSMPGLAVLSGDALEGGTLARSGRELAASLERMGASFGAATGWDSTTVAISCQADRLQDAFPLLAEMVRRPAFPPEELDRFKQQRLATITQRKMSPSSLASDEFSRLLHAEGNPYGRPLGGTEEAVSRMSSPECAAFVEAHYNAASSGLVVVGDVDPGEMGDFARDSFGDWRPGEATHTEVVAAPRAEDRRVHVVHRPGAVQSEIRVGHVGVSRGAEDFFAIEVLNLALGGSFTSRLNLNLREKHGFTYGVRSRFLKRRGPGPFLVSTAVETGVTVDAIREIHREVRVMASSGPTKEEVDAARSYLAGVFPLKLETTGQLAARVAELIVYGLEPDYYSTYRDRIRGVTVAETTDAAGRRIRPGELCTVVVGDADAVTADLEGGEFGEVTVHE